MKRLPEKLPSKACFSPFFCNLNALNLAYNYLKGVINIFKERKFEGTWDELEAKSYFQRQNLFTKNVRLNLVLMRNSALQEAFNICFSRDFC